MYVGESGASCVYAGCRIVTHVYIQNFFIKVPLEHQVNSEKNGVKGVCIGKRIGHPGMMYL